MSEQERLLEVYRNKWMAIGHSCEPLDEANAKKWISVAYESAGLRPPTNWIVCDSPLSGAITSEVLRRMKKKRDSVWDSVWDSVRGNVRNSVLDSVLKSVRNSAWDSVRNSAWDNVMASVRDSVWASVLDSVRNSAWDNVMASVRNSVWVNVWNSVWDSAYGSHEASHMGFLDYILQVVGVRKAEKAIGLIESSKYCGWWIPYKDACIIQHRHNVLRLNRDLRIHCDGGPAISYRDGFSVWALNGVRVPQWIAETPSEQIDPKKIGQIANAQVRAEAISKVGVDRWVHSVGAKTIDTEGEYELLEVPWFDGKKKKYLKMHNPSVPDLWHVEGVGDDVTTVCAAHRWRTPERFRNLPVDDVNGCDWYQQGDVYIVPRGAKSMKSRPKTLT